MDKWPKYKDEFDVFQRATGRKAIGCPCVATRLISEARIEAIDSNGFARVFYRHIWRFEKVE